jgi:hypothetical protein
MTEEKYAAVKLEDDTRNVISDLYSTVDDVVMAVHAFKTDHTINMVLDWGNDIDHIVDAWVTSLTPTQLIELVPYVTNGQFDTGFVVDSMAAVVFSPGGFAEKRDAYTYLLGVDGVNKAIADLFIVYIEIEQKRQAVIEIMLTIMVSDEAQH